MIVAYPITPGSDVRRPFPPFFYPGVRRAVLNPVVGSNVRPILTAIEGVLFASEMH